MDNEDAPIPCEAINKHGLDRYNVYREDGNSGVGDVVVK